MSNFDNNLEVVISKVVSDNPKAPVMSVRTEFGGVKYKTGVWPMTKKDGTLVKDKNGNQLYKGKYEIDDYVPQGEPNAAPPPPASFRQPPPIAPPQLEPAFSDDDLPF